MKHVRPKKNLGQHFLTDLTIARHIADTVDAWPDLPGLSGGVLHSSNLADAIRHFSTH
jgi:16S rRNA (adenine1518-N6/adenine1519-N6)-dimethyltransferase